MASLGTHYRIIIAVESRRRHRHPAFNIQQSRALVFPRNNPSLPRPSPPLQKLALPNKSFDDAVENTIMVQNYVLEFADVSDRVKNLLVNFPAELNQDGLIETLPIKEAEQIPSPLGRAKDPQLVSAQGSLSPLEFVGR